MKIRVQQTKPTQLLPKVKVQSGKLEKFPCDLLALKWVEGQTRPNFRGAKISVGQDAVWAVDRALKGLMGKMMKEQGFKGKEGEILVFPTLGKIPAKRVMVLGLGEQKNVTPELVRKSAARIIKEARRLRARKVGTIFLGTGTAGIAPFVAAKAITEGALLGGYTYHKYKSEEAKEEVKYPQELVIVTSGVHEKAITPTPPNLPSGRGGNLGGELLKLREAERGVREGEIYAEAAIFARELVNEPASNMVPKDLADIARAIAKASPNIEVKLLNRAQCEKLGMGAYLGVARGSDHEPYFIHLTWHPTRYQNVGRGFIPRRGGAQGPALRALQNDGIARIALVGKGITFDSGGMSLKPAQAMESMKCDMSGCAAMLGVFQALARLQPNVEVHGISAVCENMPSGRAMKPGDIVRTMAGKTIEVLNTDAEGRLTLADALTYATRLKPDAIIDLATLTGACIVALGEEVAGYMGNDRALLENVKKAAEAAGERVWELPLVPEYKEVIKSQVADYCNITPGKKGAGTITAGLLLAEFVGKTPWVHLDIAGPAWAEKEVIPYIPRGGTGFGVRTVLELLKHY